eukprot:TRINITY_DN3353_c0_g1_i1.p1 TRINITY_DN3353_c0_g1~~TRINITY_DN3353_c0_g1_i1.p1  ORF type:complete len:300 (-),score=52.31 TRINITY_DN3353_c0_g1_i1:159-1058(-)
MQEGFPPNQVGTPPHCAGDQSADATDSGVHVAEKAALVSSLTPQFDSLLDSVREGLDVKSPISVRPPASVGDCSQDEDSLLETGSQCFTDGAQSVPFPLGLGSFRWGSAASEGGRSASDADTLSESSHALSQAQEVSKLRRKLLDNLKGRHRQCLRTLTPLRDLDVESAQGGMRRATTESSTILYTREPGHASLEANCEALKMNASFSHLQEQLRTTMRERDEALKEVKQLRAERVLIREEIEFSGNKSAETMRPLRRFFLILVMLLMMLAGQLLAGLKRLKAAADDKGCKQYLRQKQR